MDRFKALKRFMQYLDKREIHYTFLRRSPNLPIVEAARLLDIDPARVVTAALLRDRKGLLLAIYPAQGVLDIETLNRQLHRQLIRLTEDEVRRLWPECGTGMCIPLAQYHSYAAVVHRPLVNGEDVFFTLDQHTLCQLNGKDFVSLQGSANWSEGFVVEPSQLDPEKWNLRQAADERRLAIRRRIFATDRLPTMPRIAQEILQISNNPYANVTELAAIIEQDASLTAQVIRYARSPLYGYRGEVNSVHEAIARVLGFDMVMDMALGIALGKTFCIPNGGPLGLDAFWRHSTYCAVLVQKLGLLVDELHRPRPGMAYLAGLLHNIGFLMIGNLFPKEYAVLNKAVTKYDHIPFDEIERRVLGINHMEAGEWLMQAWSMPEELRIAAVEHHNPDYDDMYAPYANLVLLANRLVHVDGLGDERQGDLPDALLQRLGLTEQQVRDVYLQMMQERSGLDQMAEHMAKQRVA